MCMESGVGRCGLTTLARPKMAWTGFPLARGEACLCFGARMDQLAARVPVLILALVAVGFAFGTLVLSVVLGKKGRREPIKDTAYECGMLPQGVGSTRFSVKFYLVAMLFILFDIEVVFLYPWAAVYKDMLATQANLIFGAMVSFLGVLFVGYLYALKKGAFDWKS